LSEALGPLGTACRLYLGTKASFFAPNWVEISLLEMKKVQVVHRSSEPAAE